MGIQKFNVLEEHYVWPGSLSNEETIHKNRAMLSLYLKIKMNDLGNTRFLEGSGAFPNPCNKKPPSPDKYSIKTLEITIYITVHNIT